MVVNDLSQGYASSPQIPLVPWTSIWTKPRLTIRQVLDENPRRHVLLLAAVGGAINGVGNSVERLAQSSDPGVLLVMCLFAASIGAAVSIPSLFLGGWILTGIGRLLGGVGRSFELRTAIAYPNIISLWMAPLVVPVALLMWYMQHEPDNLALSVMALVIGIAMIAFGLCQLGALCATVAEAHRFSNGKGFLTVMLPIGVIVACMVQAGYLAGWKSYYQ